jgi:hypothetical protein
MSSTYQFSFKRHVLRGVSDLMSITAMPAMTALAYDRMSAAQWIEVSEQESDLPRHDWAQSGFQDSFDAAKFCGDYAAGRQKAYACAACYTLKIPADALAGTVAKVEAILATVYGDRWLAEGAILSAFLTASATPPAWATIIDTAAPSHIASSPDPAPEAAAVTVPDWGAPLRQIERSNNGPDTSYPATLAPAVAPDALQWLHVVIRLSDYLSVPQLTLSTGGTRDSAWIEGGAKIDGTTLAVTFDRAVTPDSDPYVLFFPKAYTRESYDINYNNEYDVDLSIRMHRIITHLTADALTGYRHYQSLLEQRHWPVETFLTMSYMGISGDSKYGYPVFCDLIVTGLDNVGFGASTNATYASAKYMLCSLLYGRTARTKGETAIGISFDTAIPAPPSGVVFRLSIYGTEAGYVTTSRVGNGYEGGVTRTHAPAQLNTRSMVDPDFWDGIGDSLYFETTDNNMVGSSSFQIANSSTADSAPDRTAALSVPVTAIASVELTSELAAGAVVPFSTPYTLPKYAMIFAALTVGRVESTYAQSKDTSDFKQWWPKDFHVHI